MNRARYLEVKEDVRQKLNPLEDQLLRLKLDENEYHDFQSQFWRADDYLNFKALKEIDKELTARLKDLA